MLISIIKFQLDEHNKSNSQISLSVRVYVLYDINMVIATIKFQVGSQSLRTSISCFFFSSIHPSTTCDLSVVYKDLNKEEKTRRNINHNLCQDSR